VSRKNEDIIFNNFCEEKNKKTFGIKYLENKVICVT